MDVWHRRIDIKRLPELFFCFAISLKKPKERACIASGEGIERAQFEGASNLAQRFLVTSHTLEIETVLMVSLGVAGSEFNGALKMLFSGRKAPVVSPFDPGQLTISLSRPRINFQCLECH